MAVLLALSAAFMLLDYRFGYATKMRSLFSYVTSPVQYIVNWPIKTYYSLTESVLSHTALRKENIELRYQQVLLNGRLQRLKILQQENDQLRKLLSYKKQYSSSHFLLAELLVIKTDPYRQMIILDRGKKDKVFVGQSVFDSFGVIGQVVFVGRFTSTVQLITDPSSAVPVKNIRTGERGILVGNNNLNSLSLIHMPKTSQIKVGDELVTSGLGKRFPEGYPIGTINRLSTSANDAFINVAVIPKAKLSKSRLMLLTWNSKTKQNLINELSELERKGHY